MHDGEEGKSCIKTKSCNSFISACCATVLHVSPHWLRRVRVEAVAVSCVPALSLKSLLVSGNG